MGSEFGPVSVDGGGYGHSARVSRSSTPMERLEQKGYTTQTRNMHKYGNRLQAQRTKYIPILGTWFLPVTAISSFPDLERKETSTETEKAKMTMGSA